MTVLRGRWAQGIEPRGFCWIVQDRLAASERPGGFARNHRKIRRQEELIWLAGHGFTRILSLLDSPHNLHAYEAVEIAYEHVPLGRSDDWAQSLAAIYSLLSAWLGDASEKILIHSEEFGYRLTGVLTGYLLYSGFVTEAPHAVVAMEKIIGRQLDATGREIVAATVDAGLVGRGK